MTSDTWIVRCRADSTSISPDRERVCAFDLEGRPVSWFDSGRVFKRGLDGGVHGRRRSGGRRVHWRLSPAESRERLAEVLDWARRAPTGTGPRREGLSDRLARILAWSPEGLLAEVESYRRAYRPVSILPPDAYLAIVLQATEGCSWNRCTFCSFYQDRPFRAKGLDEFLDHLGQVAELLGRGSAMRRSLFLADGNALLLSPARLTPMLEAAKVTFPGRPIDGFVDLMTGERHDEAAWRALAELGLRRVSVGLESGDAGLLRSVRKPGSPADAAAFVATLKRAGLAVNLIFMVGIGGPDRAATHRDATRRLVADLPLDGGDVLYLSPYLPAGHAPSDGLPEWIEAEYGALRDDLRRVRPEPRVTRYDLREFVY